VTKFEDRLKLNQEVTAKTYKEAVWCLLIAYGGALQHQEDETKYVRERYGNFYGSSVDLDGELTQKVAAAIKTHGIDFEACSDPAPTVDLRFNDTFTSTQLEVHVLRGTLVLGDGQSVQWGTKLSDPDFGALIRLLTSDNKNLNDTINDAVEHLAYRIARDGKNLYAEVPA
jgi:hypothetical protein